MHRRSVIVLAIAAAMLLPPGAYGATKLSNAADTPRGATAKPERVNCLQGWESFLPGDYYACRALYHVQRKHYSRALEMLKEASYWANKGAQHALGLAYFNGDVAGVAANRPLGIAWLALAAERKEADYVRDYSIAVMASSPSDVAQATHIYLHLRKDYGDRVAGPRAVHRFIRRIKPLDDAAAMGGNSAWVQGLSPFPQGAMSLAQKIHAQANKDFKELQGTVTVGTFQRVEAPSPALRDRYKEPPRKAYPGQP
jgi:hypothetical protein